MEEKMMNVDEIKEVILDAEGRCERIIFNDGNILGFQDFISLFKQNLKTITAGEIITWDDVWRFSKMTDAKSFEEYLDNVEQEGIMKGSRVGLDRRQKTNILLWVLLIAGVGIFMIFLYFVLSKGIKF